MGRVRTRSRSFDCIDHYKVVEGVTVRGTCEKDVLLDPDTGFKYIAKLGGRFNDLEVITEYVIYLIGRTLGVPVATGRVASYRGSLRFLSAYFLTETEELVHGVQLFSELYDDTTVKEVLRNEGREQEMFTVQSVKGAFGAHFVHVGQTLENELFGEFVSMLTHDALIGVMDRHHENWGVIVQRSVDAPKPRFAPLYDSARGMFCNWEDARIDAFVRSTEASENLDKYVGRARPLVGCEGLKSKSGRKLIAHHELIAEVFHRYREVRPRIANVLDAFDSKLVRSELTKHLEGVCSPRRIHLILACLRRRRRLIWKTIDARFR